MEQERAWEICELVDALMRERHILPQDIIDKGNALVERRQAADLTHQVRTKSTWNTTTCSPIAARW